MDEKNKTKDRPSAADDCADVTSRYQRYKKQNKKRQFPQLSMKNLRIINLR